MTDDQTTTTRLNMTTFNVNGLHNDNKRQKTYEMLINRKIEIAFLQETHSTSEANKKYKKEWLSKSIWHSGTNLKASGVAILFKENLEIEIVKTQKDKDGQLLNCTIKFEDDPYQLINIYAPTKPDQRKFYYKNLQNFIKCDQKTILAGDFNMTENIFLDRIRGNPNNTHTLGIKDLHCIQNKNKLIDMWRKTNPYKRYFNYRNANNTIHSRLDRIYITKTIKTLNCQIIPTTISDHDSVLVTIQVNIQTPKGPGIWKLNTTILKEKQFQNTLKIFWSSWTKEKPKYENHDDWWEIGNMYFKNMAIEYSTEKNRQIKNKYNQCIEIINEEKTKSQPDTMKIKKYEIELEEIENYKKRGTVIRSKEKIILNEEKPTKYFFL